MDKFALMGSVEVRPLAGTGYYVPLAAQAWKGGHPDVGQGVVWFQQYTE